VVKLKTRFTRAIYSSSGAALAFQEFILESGIFLVVSLVVGGQTAGSEKTSTSRQSGLSSKPS
jgi:hypothetical protein